MIVKKNKQLTHVLKVPKNKIKLISDEIFTGN